MKQTLDLNSRKRLGGFAIVGLSILTVAGITLKSRSSLAASDKNSLKLQRAAMGIPAPEQMRARMLEDLARDLGLTETQKAQLKTAMESGPDARAIFEDNSLSREQKFERLRKVGLDREARIRTILTPEQQSKYSRGKYRCVNGFSRGGGPTRDETGSAPAALDRECLEAGQQEARRCCCQTVFLHPRTGKAKFQQIILCPPMHRNFWKKKFLETDERK